MPHYNRHFYGDPLCNTGVWGPPTSKANFCEEDYAVTRYLAEFINTLSNLAYVYFALRNPSLPGTRGRYFGLDFMGLGLFLVGVFSFIFHATMLQLTQFGDDMSMFLLTTAMMQMLFTKGKSPATTNLITWLIWTTVVAISAIYYQTQNIFIHFSSFFLMNCIILAQSGYLFHIRNTSGEERSRLFKQFCRGTFWMVVGFGLWNVDLEKCSMLRDLRKSIGLPGAWLFELHGWWHILSAASACEFIRIIRHIAQ